MMKRLLQLSSAVVMIALLAVSAQAAAPQAVSAGSMSWDNTKHVKWSEPLEANKEQIGLEVYMEDIDIAMMLDDSFELSDEETLDLLLSVSSDQNRAGEIISCDFDGNEMRTMRRLAEIDFVEVAGGDSIDMALMLADSFELTDEETVDLLLGFLPNRTVPARRSSISHMSS